MAIAAPPDPAPPATKPPARETPPPAPRYPWRIIAALAVLVVAAAAIAATLSWRQNTPMDDSIELAVVYSPDQDAEDFLAGVRIAIAQVNADGGILGYPVSERLFMEPAYTDQVQLDKLVAQTLRQATKIGEMPEVLAVIGHGSSVTAVPASAVYDRHGKLFLATHATATSLSNHRLDLTFALQPSNADNAAVLAEYAHSQGWKRMVVLSDNSSYGQETTDRFRSALAQQGGAILHRDRLAGSKSIDDLLLFLLDNTLFKASDIDAFFLTSSSMSDSANFIARARQLGLTMPILGPEYLYSNEVEGQAGADAMRNVVTVSLFDDGQLTPEGLRLRDDFSRIADHPPGQLAAIGFDAVKVLAIATNRTGKRDAAAIADTLRILRYEAPFIGATGKMVFDANGLITDTVAYVLRHDGIEFKAVAAYKKPLNRQQQDDAAQTPSGPAASERKP
ncbi:ABC transporter substrate-binding protein [Magnetospirillum sulfuroxidans]|uniref:ABC transporter substrate-binding protein n=1 Tax=Magnetospirillum sulfuroxidans TaxID=611300 RepID=A0ABS5I7E1_9PROT|nr:ABC transporter substrate-binding protein [Magnetospirillum sulfuroxidans]MBR9970320.1 ABC transporter substrate-binding protein [Magnetospirillum sulfuroxidans]